MTNLYLYDWNHSNYIRILSIILIKKIIYNMPITIYFFSVLGYSCLFKLYFNRYSILEIKSYFDF